LQKYAVIVKTLLGSAVLSKTLISLIVVVVDFLSLPIMALYAEVIISPSGQFTIAISAFQYGLCQSDASGDSMFLHLVDGNVFPLGNVLRSSIALIGISLSVSHERYEEDQ
jgi:hypothetical protein